MLVKNYLEPKNRYNLSDSIFTTTSSDGTLTEPDFERLIREQMKEANKKIKASKELVVALKGLL